MATATRTKMVRLEVRLREEDWMRVIRYQGANLLQSRGDALQALVISALDAANIPPIAGKQGDQTNE